MVKILCVSVAIGYLTLFPFVLTPTVWSQYVPRGEYVESQDRINGIQDEQIQRLQTDSANNARRIDLTNEALDDLTAAMNRFTGIGIGIGAVLTLLQIAQLAEMRRTGKNGNGS